MSETNSEQPAPKNRTLIFVYGTLKRGFPNYYLIQHHLSSNDAVFIGPSTTLNPYPLVLGPYGVPFLLNLPNNSHHRVHGELYSVSTKALQVLDHLEGISLGHYERLPIRVFVGEIGGGDGVGGVDGFDSGCSWGDVGRDMVEAEAYYGHRSFAEEMWKKSGGGMGCDGVYSEEMLRGYVKREDRPKERSFLQEIKLFCESD